jgi:integrase
MPFLAKNARTYKGRLRDEAGKRHIVTLSTTDYDTAAKVEAFGKQLRAERRWSVIADILAGKYSLAEAYDHRGEADQHGVREQLDTFVAERSTPDLDALLTEHKSMLKPGYYRQARVLVPQGQKFPLTEFRRGRVSTFLKSLPVSVQTRRRYKVALSAVAKLLIEKELVSDDWTNPVRDVKFERSPRRPVIRLEPHEVRALVEAIDNPKYQALEALMAGTGMEWQAVKALRRRDVDFDRRLVFAQGEKNEYRTRWVEFTEDWAWDIFVRHAQLFVPDALIFDGCDHHWVLRKHHEAAKAKQLRYTTLHHHRHSYAVMWLPRVLAHEDGRDVPWLKNQLGHAPQSTVLFTTYAVEIKAMQLTQQQQERLAAAPAKRAKGVARR